MDFMVYAGVSILLLCILLCLLVLWQDHDPIKSYIERGNEPRPPKIKNYFKPVLNVSISESTSNQ